MADREQRQGEKSRDVDTDDVQSGERDPRHALRARQMRKRDHEPQGQNAVDKQTAATYKQRMAKKLEKFSVTVGQAMNVFQNACAAEMAGEKPTQGEQSQDVLVETVVDGIFDVVKDSIEEELGGGVIGSAVKHAMDAVRAGAGVQGGSKAESFDVVSEIVKTANAAAQEFVEKATKAIDSIPDEQAATDEKLLEATQAKAKVHAGDDDAEDGKIGDGVEDLYLEAAGAPVTGLAEAEQMAVAAIRVFKAESIKFKVGGERSEAVQEALHDPAQEMVPGAEKRLGMDQGVKADKNQRERAGNLNPAQDDAASLNPPDKEGDK